MNDDRQFPIEVTSRHEPLSDRMRTYADEKLERLRRFHNRISRIQLVVDGAHEAPAVELIIHVDSGSTLVAREHREHFKSAVDLVVDKMERQLKKNNEKRKQHKGANGGPTDAAPVQPGGEHDDGEETYEDVIKRDLA